MKTIALSANTSWYIYNFRRNTILSLIEKGFSVIVIAPRDEYSEKIINLGALFIDIRINQSGTNPFQELTVIWQFHKIFSKHKIDILLNFTPKNNIYGTLAASKKNIKVINNIAGLGTLFVSQNITSKIAKSLYKFSQKYADKVFFQNESDRNLFLDNYIIPKKITDRLPGSGVDLNRFKLIHAPNDGVIRFLLVARMLYEKGVGIYVDAARLLKNKYHEKIEFSLLGFLDTNNPSSITEEKMSIWEKEGIINYLGTSDKVEEIIAYSDCIVLPSYYREGVPKSLLEAGAMGKPIITTDNIGCRETVDDGINGFLCQPKSTESLITAIEKFMNLDNKSRINMGINSRKKIASEFDEQIVINKYLESIEALLQGTK